VTFRVDDLLVAVLPEHLAADKGCPKCSKCTNRTATGSPCQPGDPDTQNCPCLTSQQDKTRKKAQTWRDEQFALLSTELEEALSR
jgi:hypothetical protein